MHGKVLIIDDDASVRSVLTRMLHAEGLEVRTAVDGLPGLDEVHRFRPDVVLLDVMMPGLSGLEVCRRLKKDPNTRLIPVVLLTALAALEDRVVGIEAGADDFLTKPLERIELIARLRSLIRMKRYTDELERAEAVVLSLARSIEAKDPYTEGHCERLAGFVADLGERLELSREEQAALKRAAFLHDIGKVAVPDHILRKPAPLTPEEWRVMRMHPVTGEHICRPLKGLRSALPIIRHHHEKGDGTGYPDGLQGEDIPRAARVLQIVDVYDALTTHRPYRSALHPEDALECMRTEVDRGWWDAEIFSAFVPIAVAASEGSGSNQALATSADSTDLSVVAGVRERSA